MSAVKSGISKLTGGLIGGKTTKDTTFTDMTPEEQKRLADIEGQINDLFGENGKLRGQDLSQNVDVQNLFTNNLKSFLTSGGQTTPEDIKRASDFVDQTFTQPTQQVVDQNVANYESQAQARAAALGRNPNADIATQQAIAGEGLRQNIGLQAERGSRIAQNTQEQYNRSLGSLNAGLQGSGYLNNLAQQAFQNQVGLLNSRTGLANIYQRERQVGKFGTSSGALTNLTAIGKGVGDFNQQWAVRPVSQAGQIYSGGLSSMGSGGA